MEYFLIPPYCALLLLGLGDVAALIVVNGILGRSVILNAHYEIPASSFIQWNYNSLLVAQYYNSSSLCTGQLIGRCQVYGNGSLRISNLSYADQGDYTLNTQILGSGSSANTTSYQLTVYTSLAAPVLRSNVTNSPIISGTYVTLQCDAGNQTVTTYTFYWEQTAMCSDPHVTCLGPFLHFMPISRYDRGFYTCTIQNSFSSSTSNSLTLTVIVPVSNVKVTSSISGLVWPGLDSVSLRCSSCGTNVSYSWSLRGAAISGGNQYHLSDNNTVLTISPVSSTDNGPFICTAKNLVSNQNSSDVYLTLASPVSAVTLTSDTSGALWAGQESASLHCTAQGSAITFSWEINGNPVSSIPPYYITQSDSPPHSNLTISPVSKNDTGPISCTASNQANSVTSNTAKVSIFWAPDGNILCTAEPIGQHIQLGCSWPGGKPAANVTMIYSNIQSTSADQVLRNLSISSNIHGSNLTCNGDQLGRTSTCMLLLEPPNSTDHINGTITPAIEGDTVVLTVNLTSGTQSRAGTSSIQVLPAQFFWFRGADTSPIQNNDIYSVISTKYTSTLKIHKVSESESGKYKCIAENFIGSTTFLFNVEVSKKVSPSNGLDGGQIAGIVIGVLAGVAIIGVIVFYILEKRNSKEAVYDNADSPPPNFYDTKLPEALIDTNRPMKEESNYQQLIHPDESIYHSVIPGAGK
ncbi:pregnancy-specific beta-1-glycoprotein 7-like isoform X2 [Dendropsophus ebraccatus]|uniref:pregnancy-specific beta-1-glycoprotein 7-like isoform X2 n=1 Tax=Dendropsophus ebraccatus TaxID=150705 RepID=UPI0038313748